MLHLHHYCVVIAIVKNINSPISFEKNITQYIPIKLHFIF